MTRSSSLAAKLVPFAFFAFAQSNLPEIWTSRTSGSMYRLSQKRGTLRAERVFPAEVASQADAGAYVRCDYTQQDKAWLGKCESRLPMQASKGGVKWCKFKFSSRITLLAPDRIEGETDVWENADVDVAKCEVRESHLQHFLWIPKL